MIYKIAYAEDRDTIIVKDVDIDAKGLHEGIIKVLDELKASGVDTENLVAFSILEVGRDDNESISKCN